MQAHTLAIALAVAAAARAVAQEGPSGTDILNFALNLECLEAEFYSYAVYGTGLSEARRGGGPPAVGGRKATLSPEIQVPFPPMKQPRL